MIVKPSTEFESTVINNTRPKSTKRYIMFLYAILMSAVFPYLALAKNEESKNVDVYQFKTEQQQQQFNHLIYELRCPKCQNQNLMDSQSEISNYMKQRIYNMVLEGESSEQIVLFLRQRYGDFITYKPPLNYQTVFLWTLPLAILLISLLFFLLRYKLKKNTVVDVQNDNQESLQQTKKQFSDWLNKSGSEAAQEDLDDNN